MKVDFLVAGELDVATTRSKEMTKVDLKRCVYYIFSRCRRY